jgi:hypothetical protein
MLKRLITLAMVLLPLMAWSQTDTGHWEADFVVRHPSGLTDTLTLGADVNGGTGYQSGLDEIDTNFHLPVSIRSHDTLVAQQYNTCHANMARDIREFQQKVTYSFYIKSDTFPRADLYPPDSCVSILYDTTQLNFKNDAWQLDKILISSYSGYLEIWDLTWAIIKSGNYFGNFENNQIPLIFEGHPFIDYWRNPCGLGNKVMKFELEVIFTLTTGIDKKPTEQVSITNNRGRHQLSILFPKVRSGRYEIFNMMGQQVVSGEFYSKSQLHIPYQLSAGTYLLLMHTDDGVIRKKFISP